MHVANELLRDRARPAAVLSEDFALDGAGDADDIDAVVLVEALVLDGDERLRHVRWERFDRHARPKLRPDLADQRAVARKDERRLRQLHDLPRLARLVRRVLCGDAARRRADDENGQGASRRPDCARTHRMFQLPHQLRQADSCRIL